MRVLPAREHGLIFGLSFHHIAREQLRTGETQTREHPRRVIADKTTVVEDVLEFRGGWRALPRAQVGQAADIRRVRGQSGRRSASRKPLWASQRPARPRRSY
jgi:hypothetical protein